MRIKLNPDKNIGQVVYIVEGERKEPALLQQVFTQVLDYTYIKHKRNEDRFKETYRSRKNPNSVVFAVNGKQSNLASIRTGRDYLDTVFRKLYEEYNVDVTRSAVYYLFDRDAKSNKSGVTEDLIDCLRSSRDNNEESNGLLLLSYPAIEAYILECFSNSTAELKIATAQKAKTELGSLGYQQNKIGEKELLNAAENMLTGIQRLSGKRLELNELDDFGSKNKELFTAEESLYSARGYYDILSMLSLSFLDLGLLEIECD
jgi:hypothetical protein